MSVIKDESLSLKLLAILSKVVQSITKRIEEDTKSYGLNPTEFAVLELLYSKGDQPIQKILLANISITYVVDRWEKKR
ncbi:MarR family transcriptional regulator [Bacillus cereus]|nr:MarR family transcriptional regulator [Bacillus cereus]PER22424.1 MarR family transcriptional regulator [Bacillus cereus]PEX93437.1 MarR family transcriptional regulator [Bacillus cereus]PEY96908.1 MarR family transcriptional regulator [Bacillus cereus]PGP62169.1 MarR family transcriptional regulator [Bacillus cereus]